MDKNQNKQEELIKKVININRISKVVKGGRRMRFSALVIVGDGRGSVGYGHAKAGEVSGAIAKAEKKAIKSSLKIPIESSTIPWMITTKFGASKVLLRPARRGRGIVGAKPVRAVMEAVGISDVVTKLFGSHNSLNVIKATFAALSSLFEGKTNETK